MCILGGRREMKNFAENDRLLAIFSFSLGESGGRASNGGTHSTMPPGVATVFDVFQHMQEDSFIIWFA